MTDNYNYIRFQREDGASSGISLNLYSPEFSGCGQWHYYELEGLEGFWSFAADRAAPVEY